MSVEVKTQTGKVSDTFTFTFDQPVRQYLVGIAGFHLINSLVYIYMPPPVSSMPVGIKVKHLDVTVDDQSSGNVVTATVDADFSNDNKISDDSTCTLSCVAVTGDADSNIVLTNVASGQFGTGVTAPNSSGAAAAVLAGITLHQDAREVLQVTAMARVNRNATSLNPDGLAFISDGTFRGGSVDVGIVALHPNATGCAIGVLPMTATGNAGSCVLSGEVDGDDVENVAVMLQGFDFRCQEKTVLKSIQVGVGTPKISYAPDLKETTVTASVKMAATIFVEGTTTQAETEIENSGHCKASCVAVAKTKVAGVA